MSYYHENAPLETCRERLDMTRKSITALTKSAEEAYNQYQKHLKDIDDLERLATDYEAAISILKENNE